MQRDVCKSQARFFVGFTFLCTQKKFAMTFFHFVTCAILAIAPPIVVMRGRPSDNEKETRNISLSVIAFLLTLLCKVR